MLKKLAWLIYPPSCRFCNCIIDDKSIFCTECKSQLKSIVPLLVPLSNKQILTVYSACAFQDPARNLIYKKFSYDTLACRNMADIMTKFIPFDVIKPDFFVPIPLHWTRFAWRGYNQSDLISIMLGKNINTKVANILKRNRRTIFQSKLSVQDRQKNVKDVFSLNTSNLKNFKNKNIVIVDDLFTSGATVKNAAQTLLSLNPNSLSVAVFCRTI